MYVLVTLTCIYGPARGKNRHNLFVVNFSEKKMYSKHISV